MGSLFSIRPCSSFLVPQPPLVFVPRSSTMSIAVYQYRVSDKPADPQAFQHHQTFQHHNPTHRESFKALFCVRFSLRSSTRLTPIILNIPSQVSFEYISCKQFFQEGPTLLRRNLSHPLLPPEALDMLIPKMMSDAQRLYHNHPRCRSHVGNLSAVYPLAVDVRVELPENEEVVAVIERTMWESMQQVRMVPASKEAIQSLNTVKLEAKVADTNHSQCCICLEEFDDGVDVLAMPCHHVYHSHCIVQWLKSSHFCPLCRYPMPVRNNS